MVNIDIPSSLMLLIDGGVNLSEDTLLYKRIDIRLADFDPFNDDQLATIEFDDLRPIQENYFFESDVVIDATAIAAQRGTDGETLILTVKEK
jgi:hypothetical protein